MCLQPSQIQNKSIYKQTTAKAEFTVACGKCAECIELKRSSYLVRAYWEYYNAYSKGGYAFMDTLTYRPSDLPHFGNKSCFSRDDVQKFFKLLKVNLTRHWYKPNNFVQGDFKYFIVCERGDEKDRPHYHVIFFVGDKNLPPLVLKKWIKRSWTHGFVDPMFMVNQHILKGTMAVSYVTKYLQKQDTIYLDSLKDEKDRLISLDPSNIESIEKQYKRSKPFARTSTNFGVCALDYIDKEILSLGRCYFMDSSNLRKVLALPVYYKRKYFYDLRHYLGVDGKQHYSFTLNAKGFEYVQKTFEIKRNNILDSLKMWLDNDPDARSFVFHSLHGRSLHDLATYKLVYQRTHIDYNLLHSSPQEYYLSQFANLDFINWLYDPNGSFLDKWHECQPYLNACFNQDFESDDGVKPFDWFDDILTSFDGWCNRNSQKIIELSKVTNRCIVNV